MSSSGSLPSPFKIRLTSKGQGTYVALGVLDDQQNRALYLGHLPVHTVQAESVLAGAEYEGPQVALCPGGQMAAKLLPVLVAEDLSGAYQIWHDHFVVQGDGAVGVQSSPELLAHRQYLRIAQEQVSNLLSWLGVSRGLSKRLELSAEFIVLAKVLERLDIATLMVFYGGTEIQNLWDSICF